MVYELVGLHQVFAKKPLGAVGKPSRHAEKPTQLGDLGLGCGLTASLIKIIIRKGFKVSLFCQSYLMMMMMMMMMMMNMMNMMNMMDDDDG